MSCLFAHFINNFKREDMLRSTSVKKRRLRCPVDLRVKLPPMSCELFSRPAPEALLRAAIGLSVPSYIKSNLFIINYFISFLIITILLLYYILVK
jgi:hypothetical protein